MKRNADVSQPRGFARSPPPDLPAMVIIASSASRWCWQYILKMKRPRRDIASLASSLQKSNLPLRAKIIDDKDISKNNKCMKITLLAMATFALYLCWYTKRGIFAFDMSRRHNFPVIDERCEAAAKQLKKQNINLLALDFDLTIIDRHTGGRWKGTAKELAEHVRPELPCLLNSAFNRQIDAAIVTFSE